jgi:hypothetical protein
MFVAVGVAILIPGCTPRHILQMSSPEQASTVSLLDAGESADADDDKLVVLDQPARIARVAAFFQKRTQKWEKSDGKMEAARRYQISFRKGDDVTDRFWIAGGSLVLHSPNGQYFTCDLSETERSQLLSLFAESRQTASRR